MIKLYTMVLSLIFVSAMTCASDIPGEITIFNSKKSTSVISAYEKQEAEINEQLLKNKKLKLTQKIYQDKAKLEKAKIDKIAQDKAQVAQIANNKMRLEAKLEKSLVELFQLQTKVLVNIILKADKEKPNSFSSIKAMPLHEKISLKCSSGNTSPTSVADNISPVHFYQNNENSNYNFEELD